MVSNNGASRVGYPHYQLGGSYLSGDDFLTVYACYYR